MAVFAAVAEPDGTPLGDLSGPILVVYDEDDKVVLMCPFDGVKAG